MKRHNRRPDRRRIKSLRSYSIEEVARILDVHRNTGRHWIKAGLPTIDHRHPVLIRGADLAQFLSRRREARRQRCQPTEMFCLKCRKPRVPDGRMADYIPSSPTSGALVGLCPVCGTWMNRRTSAARLEGIKVILDVHTTQPQSRLRDTADPCLDCHSRPKV